MTKKSLRVEIENELHDKLKRITAANGTTASDLIRKSIESMSEPYGHLDLNFLMGRYERLWKKLEFWTRQRMYRYHSGDEIGINKAINQEVQRYLADFLGATSVTELRRSFSRWDGVLSPQEKSVVGSFFPFRLNAFDPLAKEGKFFIDSSFYNLKDGEYIVLKEPEIHGFTAGGVTTGIVTINAYSAHILNTPEMMIVDVDTDWSGDDGIPECVVVHDEAIALFSLRLYQSKNPESSFRVYRTTKGLRYIRTDKKVEPGNSYLVMRELMADPKYRALCLFQETYRARLTPKPWRTEYASSWYANDQIDPHSEYRVCELIEIVGDPDKVLEEFRPMIEYHDTWTKALDKNDALCFA